MATKATTGRTRKKAAEVEPAMAPEPGDIAKRAYELYEAGTDGGELEHWLQAERELVGAPS